MHLFPFEKIRLVQKEFLESSRKALSQGKILIAHAPTGIGKTAAALSAGIERAIEKDLKVLFLTPRHSQHEIAVETIKKIQERHNIEFSTVDLIGKKWLCNQQVAEMSNYDFQQYCKDLRKEERCEFYNKVFRAGELTEEALNAIKKIKSKTMHAEEIKAVCSDLCPYYISLEAAKSSLIIIADYYHIFHPEIKKSLCKRTNTDLEKVILIVDEAHNLPDRIREISSSKITNLQLERARKEAEFFGFYDISENISSMLKIMKELAAKKLGRKVTENFLGKEELNEKLSAAFNMESFLEEIQILISSAIEKRKRSYSNSLKKFLILWQMEKEGFARIIRKEIIAGKAMYEIIIRCLDPGMNSEELFSVINSGILMSGTLTPASMYSDLLGIKNRALEVVYPSPYPKENRLNIISCEATTRYSKRGSLNYKKIGYIISRCSLKVPRNMAVFFPSYELLDKISPYIRTEKNVIREKKGLSKIERKIMLDNFRKGDSSMLLGVIGGSFDQGIDYPDNKLSAVSIVGIPLEKPDLETKALIDFYDLKFGRGWDYGYIFPAVNKAIQASGRCIRSERDKAVCLFIDERYLWGSYRKAFPPDLKLSVSAEPWREIEEFFKNSG